LTGVPLRAPIPQSYWVLPGTFLAGAYPGAETGQITRQILQRLIDAGIRQFFNLMELEELDLGGWPFPEYDTLLKDLGDKTGVDVGFERMPIRDMWVPTDGQMDRILDRIDNALEEDKAAYVHCLGGRGRTGTVVGCFLARHGYARSLKALDRINDLRKNTENRHRPSPETREQINMVLRWR